MAMKTTISVQGHTSGRWYFEVVLDAHEGGQDVWIGIGAVKPFENVFGEGGGAQLGNYQHTAINGVDVPESDGFTNGDRVGVAVCFTETEVKVWFSVNGVWQEGGLTWDEGTESYVWAGRGGPDSSEEGGTYPTGEGLPLVEYWATASNQDTFTVTLCERAADLMYPIPTSYLAWRQ